MRPIKIVICFVLLLLLIAFSACKKKTEETAATEASPAAEVEVPEKTVSEPAVSTVLNPVTGLPVLLGREKVRPVAIMINNLKIALPQEGISKADIYFELPTEGATNRIMAIFYDYENIGSIGPVRSARDYYVDYALPLDAVFLHYGGSPQYYSLAKQMRFSHLDGINGTVDRLLYWRDEARKKKSGTEHSVLTKGSNILKALTEFKIKTEFEETYTPYFSFTARDTAAGAIPAQTVKIPFSHYIAPTFTYDALSKTYFRSEYDSPHVDANTKEQISVKNIVVLKTPVRQIAGDEALRLEVQTSGSGSGYYISNGTAKKIIWKKKDRESPLKLYEENAVTELQINAGKTWVCVLDSSPVME